MVMSIMLFIIIKIKKKKINFKLLYFVACAIIADLKGEGKRDASVHYVMQRGWWLFFSHCHGDTECLDHACPENTTIR